MKKNNSEILSMPLINRRRFVTGATAGIATLGFAAPAYSLDSKKLSSTYVKPTELRGNHFELSTDYREVNYTGQARYAVAVNGANPAPTLRWKEGETVTINVKNNLAEDTSIHWHGIILPTDMDGVPGLSFAGIKPGETFTYQFKLNQSGTYWYHSHSGFQEQQGHYGAIVIDPIEPDDCTFDREYTVILSDWTDENPGAVYKKLKKMPHYYNTRERTVQDLWRDIKNKGVKATWNDRAMWNQMRMSNRDISDVTGWTYTFLMNGNTPDMNWRALFKNGERIKLRFINAAAMTFFDVRIPGLDMLVIAADGQNIEPVSVEEFRIGVAETYDVLVKPSSDVAYSIFAQAIDRSGYAVGTLTPDESVIATIPDMDPAPVLSHMDMGMDMSSGAHAGHNMHSMGEEETMSGMSDMDHSGHDMAEMDHSNHDMSSMMTNGKAGFGSTAPIVHGKYETGPHIDMLAEAPMSRLDDPGIGLKDNGRRVLTYADLINRYPTIDQREPSREIQLHLTGNMSRYMWSINGIKFADAEPLELKYGERVRITLVNDTMMNHPIHLHGVWSELETGNPKYIPRKHTIIVQPGSKISYLVTADAKGRWAYHCHLLYHMLGMFREVRIS